MHARVFTLQVIPEKMPEFMQAWHQVILPAAQAQAGWRSAKLLVDRKTGKAVMIGFWETEADEAATRAGSAYAEQQGTALAGLLTAPPAIEHYEVAWEA